MTPNTPHSGIRITPRVPVTYDLTVEAADITLTRRPADPRIRITPRNGSSDSSTENAANITLTRREPDPRIRITRR